MKIVIDIDEMAYDWLKNGYPDEKDGEYAIRIILNGTPLPKEHGRLIDADKIANEINALKDNWNRYENEYESGRYESYDYAVDVIEDAPTIIPAESEEEQ